MEKEMTAIPAEGVMRLFKNALMEMLTMLGMTETLVGIKILADCQCGDPGCAEIQVILSDAIERMKKVEEGWVKEMQGKKSTAECRWRN